MTDAISIRPAEQIDAMAVLEIERSCTWAPHWTESMWAQVFLRQSLYDVQDAVQGPQRQCLIAEQAGRTVGFVVVSILGTVAELESIAVLDGARRHGVGRSLCFESFLWSQTKGAAWMQLEVRSASAAAVCFYQSLGFVEEGRRRGYYREPLDDALLMRMPLLGNAAKV